MRAPPSAQLALYWIGIVFILIEIDLIVIDKVKISWSLWSPPIFEWRKLIWQTGGKWQKKLNLLKMRVNGIRLWFIFNEKKNVVTAWVFSFTLSWYDSIKSKCLNELIEMLCASWASEREKAEGFVTSNSNNRMRHVTRQCISKASN